MTNLTLILAHAPLYSVQILEILYKKGFQYSNLVRMKETMLV